jgi:hypothetical protein
LGSVSLRTRRESDPVEPLTHVLCFDFNTQYSGLLTQMFSFMVQFENTHPNRCFPASSFVTLERRHDVEKIDERKMHCDIDSGCRWMVKSFAHVMLPF